MPLGPIGRFPSWTLVLILALMASCGGGSGVPVGPPKPADISLHGWYITQAVQKLDRSIPLVAQRDGVLRVFLKASGANRATPMVRVTITGGAISPWQRVIPAPTPSVPTQVDENDINSSWNLRIPGSALAPDGHIQLEVDPDQAVAEVDPTARQVQSALEVRRVPVLRITLIPVAQSGLTGEVETGGRTREGWLARFRAMYPVAGIDLRVGPVHRTTANLNDHPDDDHDWAQLLGELGNLRLANGDAGCYYYGVVKRSNAHGTHGQTPVAAQEAAGWDDLAGYQDTFAHEMGHALGRNHAPCGVPVFGHDTGWPSGPAHAQAALGAAGLDVATMTAKASPAFRDIMGYCPPYWVSDVTYLGIMRWNASAGVSFD